jgi:hypothetical protein
MKKYAVLLDNHLLAVFPASSLAEAVENKQQLQSTYNTNFKRDEVFHVREATAEETGEWEKGAILLRQLEKPIDR